MKLDAKTIASLELPANKSDAIHFDGALSGFGYRLRRSGDEVRRTWIAQYRLHGATRRALLGSAEILTAEQARAAAKKILAAVALGQDPQEEKTTQRAKAKFTLSAVADEYLLAKESTVRARTLTESRRYLTGPYFKPLHTTPIERIGRRDVASRLTTISRESGTVTAARARSALNSLFVWAMGEGIAEANPVIGTNKPADSIPRARVLTDAELVAIWRACGDDDFGRIVHLCILTGQRRTEVGGLRWPEIDREHDTWTIPSKRTKNGREHVLPLSTLALDIIGAVPHRIGRDHLFGERASRGFTAWAPAKSALDARLNDQVAKWVLHDLRRAFATKLCDLGAAPHVVEQILNHQSGHRRGVVAVYNKSRYEREVKAAMALWDDHIRTLLVEGSGGERKIVPMPPRAS